MMTLVVGLSGRGYQVIPRLKFQVEALPSDAASFNSGLYGGSEDSAPYESLLRSRSLSANSRLSTHNKKRVYTNKISVLKPL